MAVNTFSEFKFFSSTSTKDLEEKINKFLNENSGNIEVVKRTMTIISWGKLRTWDPVIQVIIGYKRQKTSRGEMVRIIKFESNNAERLCEDCSAEISSSGGKITDLLLCSNIPDVQFNHSNCVLAVFLKT